ncbi:hypothetical protein D3C84_1030060 [compost metagenome]
MLKDVAPGGWLQRGATAGAQTADHQMHLYPRYARLLDQRIGHRGEAPAPGTHRVHHIEQAGLGHTQFSIA